MKLTDELFRNPFITTAYGERFLNDSKGRFEDYSEVDVMYDPQGDISHIDLPYCILSRERCAVLQSSPSPELLSFVKTANGYKFFWHPDVIRNEFRKAGTVRVQPTGSTRTLLTEADPLVYIKTDLDKKHFRFIRRLQQSSVEHSVAICNDLRQFTNMLPCTVRYAFLPESLGIVVRGGSHEGSGVIFREAFPCPVVHEKRLLLPYHALYAQDPFHSENKPLLVQMIKLHAKADKIGFFVSEIVGPILEAWVLLVSGRGLLPELHGQNALAEIDEWFRIRRVVHRDFQAIYSDSTIRIGLGLPTFIKHIAGNEPGTTLESQYSVVFDWMIGGYLISRMTKVFCQHADVKYTVVAEAIRSYHRSIPGSESARFPSTIYRFGKSARDQIGNEVALVDTGEKPEFR
jgi:siderophore synthetase component